MDSRERTFICDRCGHKFFHLMQESCYNPNVMVYHVFCTECGNEMDWSRGEKYSEHEYFIVSVL